VSIAQHPLTIVAQDYIERKKIEKTCNNWKQAAPTHTHTHTCPDAAKFISASVICSPVQSMLRSVNFPVPKILHHQGHLYTPPGGPHSLEPWFHGAFFHVWCLSILPPVSHPTLRGTPFWSLWWGWENGRYLYFPPPGSNPRQSGERKVRSSRRVESGTGGG